VGTHFGEKLENVVCIVLQNMDGIPTLTNGDVKLDCICHFIDDQQSDILATTELKMAWDLLPYTNRLQAKTKGWWETVHWSVAHNKCNKFGDGFQPGGTAILVLNQLAHRAMKPGNDPLGLEHWSWVHLWGKMTTMYACLQCTNPASQMGTSQPTSSTNGGFPTNANKAAHKTSFLKTYEIK